MKIYEEKQIKNFEFWCGAKEKSKYLTDSKLETAERKFEIPYFNGMGINCC